MNSLHVFYRSSMAYIFYSFFKGIFIITVCYYNLLQKYVEKLHNLATDLPLIQQVCLVIGQQAQKRIGTFKSRNASAKWRRAVPSRPRAVLCLRRTGKPKLLCRGIGARQRGKPPGPEEQRHHTRRKPAAGPSEPAAVRGLRSGIVKRRQSPTEKRLLEAVWDRTRIAGVCFARPGLPSAGPPEPGTLRSWPRPLPATPAADTFRAPLPPGGA